MNNITTGQRLPGSMHRNRYYDLICKNLSIICAHRFYVLIDFFLKLAILNCGKWVVDFLISGEYFKHNQKDLKIFDDVVLQLFLNPLK